MSIDVDRLPDCPRCGGEHLVSLCWTESLSWKHKVECPLYERDSATAARDNDHRNGLRPATPTEMELTRDQYETPPEGLRFGVRFRHSGIHNRVLVFLDESDRAIRTADRRGADDV